MRGILLGGARLGCCSRRSLRTEIMKFCRSGLVVSGVHVLRIFRRESSVGSLSGSEGGGVMGGPLVEVAA